MMVRDESGAICVKPGGTAGRIFILSQQIMGQDFFCFHPLPHAH